MPLTYYERKARLPFGAVLRVAEKCSAPASTVSRVLADKLRNRAIESALAALMRDPATGRRVTVSEAFGPPARTLRRARVGVDRRHGERRKAGAA